MVNEHTAAPYPREAEDSVIASLLVSDYAPRDVFATGLEASDFWQAKHQIAYAACKRLFEAGRPINGVSVADDLHTRGELDALGGSGWLLELTTDLPTAVAAADYAGIVARYAGFRRLLEAGQTIGQRGWQAGPDFEAALAEAEALLRGVREKAVALGKPRHIADVVAEGAERLAAWKANPGKLAGFRTGFAALDYALNGIEPGRVIMAAARTSVGKSMFAINLAFPLAEAVPVLYLSLEMTRDQLKNRALFAKAVVNRRAVQTRGYLYPDESEALDRAEGWLMGHALWLEDESSHRWGAIVGCIENAIARDGIRVVIIDHL